MLEVIVEGGGNLSPFVKVKYRWRRKEFLPPA